MVDAAALAARLTDAYGVRLTISTGRDAGGLYTDISASDLEPSEGFQIRVRFGWRSVEANFVPGTFAAGLIETMGETAPTGKEVFGAFACASAAAGGTIAMRINNIPVDPAASATWPGYWQSLCLSLRRVPVSIDVFKSEDVEAAVYTWGGLLLGMVLSLLPLEEATDHERGILSGTEGLSEGAITRVEVSRYERSAVNRAACIAIRGATCSACGFSFGEFYGPIGKGFIHIHHVTPVSELDPGYAVDPARDLVPVCANCHAMLHREDPPLTVSELAGIIRSRRSSSA